MVSHIHLSQKLCVVVVVVGMHGPGFVPGTTERARYKGVNTVEGKPSKPDKITTSFRDDLSHNLDPLWPVRCDAVCLVLVGARSWRSRERAVEAVQGGEQKDLMCSVGH